MPSIVKTSARLATEDNRKRILHYLPNPIRAGVEEHALSILAALPDYGFTPYLAAPSELLVSMRGELAGARVISFPVQRRSRLDLSAARALFSIMRRERVDLVHAHMFSASMLASPLARLARVPAVVETLHGREAWRMRNRVKGSFWIDRQISRLCVDTHIAVSKADREHLINNKRIAARKIRQIYNGRDLDFFHPPTAEERARAKAELATGDKRVLLVLGRLHEQKGHRYLLDALAQIKLRWPNVVTLLAGSGPLESELTAQRDQLGLAGSIRFLGFRDDPMRLLAAADLVVLPSLYEGLPLVAVESLAAARPLIATDVGGSNEVVFDGQTGLLVPGADSSALARAIERLLSDPKFAAEVGRRGHDFVHQRFDLRSQLDQTIALYRELLHLVPARARPDAIARSIDPRDGSVSPAANA